jgi:hypothetical protein
VELNGVAALMTQVRLVAVKMKIILKNKIIAISIILASLLALNVVAFTTSGSGKTFDFAITSGKNNELSSDNYEAAIVVGDTTGDLSSSNFIAEIGFLRATGYVTGEACNTNLECTGGFCCSNKCQSTACTVEEESASSSTTGRSGGSCSYDWQCTEWSACSEDGQQIRTCINTGTCLGDYGKPDEGQECVYEYKVEEEVEESEEIGAGKVKEIIEVEKPEGKKFKFTDYISSKSFLIFVITALLVSFSAIFLYAHDKFGLKPNMQQEFYELTSKADYYIRTNRVHEALETYHRLFPIYVKLVYSDIDKGTKKDMYMKIAHIYNEFQDIKMHRNNMAPKQAYRALR